MSWPKRGLSFHLFKCIMSQNIYIRKWRGGTFGRCLEALVTHLWENWVSSSSVGKAVLFVFCTKAF